MQVVEQCGKAAGPLGKGRGFFRRVSQAVQRVDEDKGVFVDGVAMVTVTDDKGVDAMELWQEEFKDAPGVHAAQSEAGGGAAENALEVPPKGFALFHVRGEDGQGGFDAFFRGRGETEAGFADGLKGAEDEFKVLGCVAVIHRGEPDAFVRDA